MIGCKLATCPYDTDKAEDEGEDPTRGAAEAMTVADVGCSEERRGVEEQFEDGNPTTSIKLHGAGIQIFLVRTNRVRWGTMSNDEDDGNGMKDWGFSFFYNNS